LTDGSKVKGPLQTF